MLIVFILMNDATYMKHLLHIRRQRKRETKGPNMHTTRYELSVAFHFRDSSVGS
ncbi:hypothetical protein YC2023_021702 [Brassica napus]